MAVTDLCKEERAPCPGSRIGAAGQDRLSQQDVSLLLEGLILFLPHLTACPTVPLVPGLMPQ